MTLRKILVHLTGDPSDQMALETAFRTAGDFRSCLDALFFRAGGAEEAPLVDSPGLLTDTFVPVEMEDGESHYRLARRYFHAACTHAAFREVDTHEPGGGLTARLRKADGNPDALAIESRASDLVVFAHHGSDIDATVAQARQVAISLAGRPALICPPVLAGGAGEAIMIAWNGTGHATRAIVGAMPLLIAAREVRLVCVRSGQQNITATDEQAMLMAEYLRLHDVSIRDAEIIGTTGSTAPVLLQEAGEMGADLLVMGCSGKGRLSEFILGSVSRDVIATAKLPLLIAH